MADPVAISAGRRPGERRSDSAGSVLHGPPLMVQFAGRLWPTTTKPNEVACPGASAPFQAALVKTRCWPERTSTESQLLEIVSLVGRSKTTVHCETEPGPSLAIVYCA